MSAPRPSSPAVAPVADVDERLRARLMAHSLGRLLDRVRGAREVLPHLAALERGLFDEGLDVLARVPRQGLAKICSQLGSLPLPEDDPPLHALLTRLMDTLEAAAVPAPAAPAAPPPPAAPPRSALRLDRLGGDELPFDMERTVVIQEISHSDFMAASRADMPTQFDDPRTSRDEL